MAPYPIRKIVGRNLHDQVSSQLAFSHDPLDSFRVRRTMIAPSCAVLQYDNIAVSYFMWGVQTPGSRNYNDSFRVRRSM